MSDSSVRAILADAASTVEGLTGQPYFVQTTSAGVVLIDRDHTDYPNPFGGVTFWTAHLTLPQDFAAAQKYEEDKVPALRDALAPHMVITAVAHHKLYDFGAGTLPCAVITGHREED